MKYHKAPGVEGNVGKIQYQEYREICLIESVRRKKVWKCGRQLYCVLHLKGERRKII